MNMGFADVHLAVGRTRHSRWFVGDSMLELALPDQVHPGLPHSDLRPKEVLKWLGGPNHGHGDREHWPPAR